ncbi:MAG: FtsW/RodA/SpoVE family cell cycle protein [candidate division WWE3 bacterium]|nr:FtsW/RodA/SpoVE family cell cycle protein [candidate division WWE3 bacterium]
MRHQSVPKIHQPDWVLFFILLGLLVFGIIAVYDASVVTAANVFGGKYYFMLLQLFWSLVGIAVFFVFSNLNYQVFSKFAKWFYIIGLIFLVLVLIPSPFAPVINGARRWFYINPSPLPLLPFFGRLGFQPAELAKFCLIVYLSKLFTDKNRRTVIIFLVTTAVYAILIGLEPDFGTSVITLGIGLSIFFISGASLAYFAAGLPSIFAVGLVYVLSSAYRKARLLTFINRSSVDNSGAGYHIQQILIALGSGGLFGIGLGSSRQKYGFVPEVQTDSILAIVGEELGLLGTLLLVSFFGLLIWRLLKIVGTAPDNFSKFITVGFSSWVGVQVLMNLAAMTHLIPLTGVPLPLISYGGSAMIFMLSGLGVVFGISKYAK